MRALAASLLLVVTLALSPLAALAQGWIDQPFDPAPMSREDIATVQVALAYTGDFLGTADGVWRDDSQKALAQYVARVAGNVAPTYRHLKDLVLFLEDERVANGWQLFYSDTTGVSYLHPYELLKEVDNDDAAEYLSDDGGLSLMVRFTDEAGMRDIHDWFQSSAIAGSKPYRYSDDNLWITDAKLKDDMTVYARSDLYNGAWSTLSVVATPDHFFRMNVIAVSMTKGGSPATLMWTDGGVLDQVINGSASASLAPPENDMPDPKDQVRRPVAEGVAETPPPADPIPEPGPGPDTIEISGNQPEALPDPGIAPDPGTAPGVAPDPGAGVIGVGSSGAPPLRAPGTSAPGLAPGQDGTVPPAGSETPRPKVTGTLKGSGTGFYITPTTLVTAAHVVDGCGAMAMVDGTPLDVVASDSSLDLAILSGATDTGVWLRLSALEVPKLGEAVTVLGYPYFTNLDQGLTVTSGNVSALRGADGSSNRVMITAPVQPGNSGGPLLNKKGAVIGVVVSRMDDLAVLEETGTLPQNMNFAVPSGPLLTFLAQSRITRPQGAGSGGDLSGEVPDGVANAVVPLYCYQ